jgi:hypothetical protein
VANPDVVGQSILLDVTQVPVLMPPVTKAGRPRKNAIHYADVTPGNVIIHSEPTEVKVFAASTFAVDKFAGADGINWNFATFKDFWQFVQVFKRNAIGCIIGPANRIGRII